MVIYENIENNLVRAYSDAGMFIHGGYPESDYAEAIDPIDKHREYIETDILIPEIEEPDIIDEDENMN